MNLLNRVLNTALLVTALIAGAQAAANELALHVTPAKRLVTDPASIVLAGAPPGAEVMLEATVTDKGGTVWSSRGVYFVGHDGKVDVSRQASLSGTYTGVDAEGLFWSMLPVPAEQLDGASIANRDEDWPTFPDFDSWNAPYELRKEPAVINFRASIRGLLTGSLPPATAKHKVSYIGEGVKRTVISEGDMHGVLYEAAGEGPHPLAMVITGSGGGVNEGKAALLASKGITTLTLAHFNYPGRPKMLLNIPLEYFSKSMTWLAERYGRKRVAILGGSRGGEGVLLIASTFPDQVSTVVAEVPSNMVFAGCCTEDGGYGPAWTLNGEEIPHISWEASELNESAIWGPSMQAREAFRQGITDHDYDDPRWIPVERIKSPVLMVTGDADGLWAGDIASQRVLERLKDKGFTYPAEHINYAGASHIVAMPMLVKSLADRVRSSTWGFLSMGGVPKANAFAQTDAFKQTVDFIKLHYSE
ncbi:MAG: acyl-CoA thioesterase/bile acid-CoA:amino acid N-acyltransferase family protein [Pseudomonadota bacterium]